ncbi:MAG TPA: SurA N-terminal domain-containing protein [Wenzhouxiangella sp.]|nr:SurA N-terminal domain-containing protein [Wenzhouxiangella sp.]
MLQAIRDRLTGIIAIFVFGLLAVPFMFWGIDSYTSSMPQDAVASVGDDEILSLDFQSGFAQHRARLRQQMGDSYNDVEAGRPEARREYLESMIDEILLRQYAKKAGLAVSNQVIAQLIRSTPAFQIEGQFNPDAYRQALTGAGETVGSFERRLRDDVQTRLVPMALAGSAVVTEPEVDRLISLRNQTRQVSMIDISADDFGDQVDIADDEIQSFYDDNLDRFTSEERVKLSYVVLEGADLLDEDDVSLSEDELRQHYESARHRFMTPESRLASHILITPEQAGGESEAETLAVQLLERIENGESFEALAAEYSDDPASAGQGGSLGWIEPDDMVEPFENALYALADAGDISEPVETRFGWHLIRVDEIRPPQGQSFEEARAEILEEYVEREREDLYLELSQRMVDLVYADDSSLEPLAEELDLEIQETGWFTRAGAEEGIAASEDIVEAAFSDLVLLDEAVADPVELDGDRMVAIHLAGHEPSEPRPLADVSDEIREHLIRQKSTELARERAQALLDRLGDDDNTLESVAEADDLEVTQIAELSRNDFQHGMEFLREAFQLPAPGAEPTLHVLPRNNGFAVVRLEGVTSGNPSEADETTRDMVRRQLQMMRSQEAVEGLLAQLRDSTKISVDESRL